MIEKAAAFIAQRDPAHAERKLLLVLGSGWGEAAKELLEEEGSLSYGEIPGFPVSTVNGHAGRLLWGRLEGAPLYCMQGRFHYYEGYEPEVLAMPLRVFRKLGTAGVLLTNAAGGIREDMGPGDLMLIRDHINLMGMNPLRGENAAAYGPRFPDMTAAWDRDWRNRLRQLGEDRRVGLTEGVYLAVSGPSFETPAEIRAFASLGADAVGMSTVPECLVARHAGMRVAGLSCITNAAAGLGGCELSHEEVASTAASAKGRIVRLLQRAVPELSRTLHDHAA
ncbi:MAG: purine-nucleoside phosphorylase [Verrucomicrobia bacterium]|jgi:purine-nucleoside phosphorylase|nr:purine-nucleoside phosphorylase [Verrucomicrobiota bacterium]